MQMMRGRSRLPTRSSGTRLRGPSGSNSVLKGDRPDALRLEVLVYKEVLARLAALGIEDPRMHFVGKTVVISGKVAWVPTPGDGTAVILPVKNLDQIESITPTK